MTLRENEIIRQLSGLIGKRELKLDDLLREKEIMLDRLRYLLASLKKNEEKGKKIRDNRKFQNNAKDFFRGLGTSDEKTGKVPHIDQFVYFWGSIWEDETTTPLRPRMIKVRDEISSKVNNVIDFEISEDELIRQIKKDNWTAPGIDGIQNFWWKKLSSTWPVLKKLFEDFKLIPENVPSWFAVGRTVLSSKTNDLSKASYSRPITCLNTVYKILTGCIASFVKDHSIRNNLWDNQQLGATSGVLGTVDQLLVDECIMQQVKDKHKNLSVAYYDY